MIDLKGLISGAAVTVLSACGPAAPTAQVGRGIVGGGPAGGDHEVFMISFSVLGVPNMCSATLISERTLLTAAHCLDTRYYPGGSRIRFKATNAADARAGTSNAEIDIVATVIHPNYGVLNGDDDLGLALLAYAPPGTSPKPWNRTDSRLLLGAPIRTLGYGFTDPEDYWSYGLRSEVELWIRDVDDHFLFIGDQQSRGFCNGDSGGPSFHLFPDGVERVVGVHAAGETCTDGRDVRVDVHAAFIDGWIAANENPMIEEPEPTVDAGLGADSSADAETTDAASPDAGAPTDATPVAPPVDLGASSPAPRSPEAEPDAGETSEDPEEVRTLREVPSCQSAGAANAGSAWLLVLLALAWRGRGWIRAPSRARCG